MPKYQTRYELYTLYRLHGVPPSALAFPEMSRALRMRSEMTLKDW